MGRPRFHRRRAPHTRPPRGGTATRASERDALCCVRTHSLSSVVYMRTRRDATVLLVTRARHTDAHRTGLRKLHPAESDREKYKECERTETQAERGGGKETEERKRARYWQCSSALRKFSTATHSTTTRSSTPSSHPPALPLPTPPLLLPPAPDPSSIRARFCRVHRQINGVANTGRYICPRPHRPRSVHHLPLPPPPVPFFHSASPRDRALSPRYSLSLSLLRCLSATLYRVIIKFCVADADGPMNGSIVP